MDFLELVSTFEYSFGNLTMMERQKNQMNTPRDRFGLKYLYETFFYFLKSLLWEQSAGAEISNFSSHPARPLA